MKYLGIDWAKEVHRAVLLAQDGGVLWRGDVDSDRGAVDQFLDRLEAQGGPHEVLVAIEPGAILLVERLLSERYRVWPLNPKQADRFREALRASGAKDDDWDAEVLARVLRMEHERLPELHPEDEKTEELLLRSKTRLRLVQERVGLCNRLQATLGSYFPAALALKRRPDDPFLLELLKQWPDPASARGLSRAKLRSLLEKHRIRVLSAEAAQEVLRAPMLSTTPHRVAALRDEVLGLVERIQMLGRQIEAADGRLEELFESHPDRDLLLSLPGMGKTLAIRVGTGLGRSRIQAQDSKALAAYAGATPVTRSTGSKRRRGKVVPGTKHVAMRHACNRQLQADIQLWARVSLRTSAWAKAAYAADIGRGVGSATALRKIAGKWIRILAAVLRTRKPYDEGRYVKSLRKHGVPWAKSIPRVA